MDERTPRNTENMPSWAETFKVYLEAPTLRMLFLGFSAGLPLLLVLGTLSFRLREAGIDRTTIGYLSWVGLAYGFKWCWAPLVDRLPIPLLTRALGRRRSWLLVSQLCIVGALVGMALGGWMSGWVFDMTGSYDAAFLNGIGWNLLNMSIAGFLYWRVRGMAPRTTAPQAAA